MTTLTYTLARALAKTWRAGDEIVVSRLDHDANIRPWVQLAEERGVDRPLGRGGHRDRRAAGLAVRRAGHPADPPGRAHRGQQRDRHLPRRRRRSPHRAHAVGALVYVDAVARRPAHVPRPRRAGRRLPRPVGVQVVRPARGRRRRRSAAAGRAAPGQAGARSRTGCPTASRRGRPPSSCTPGSPPPSTTWPAWAATAAGSRRDRLRRSMAAVARYEGELFGWLDDGAARDAARAGARPPDADDAHALVHRVAACGPGRSPRSSPGRASAPGTATTTPASCSTPSASTRPAAPSGWGCMHYNTADEVDRVIDAVAARPGALNRTPPRRRCRTLDPLADHVRRTHERSPREPAVSAR